MKRWFVRKYRLPVTHDAYTSLPEGEWLEEMYADLYAEKEQAVYSLKSLTESGLPAKAQEAERRRLHAEVARLASLLDEPMPSVMSDPVIDDIEARMARGETDIDLSALLPKGWKPPPQ